ncbi:MAG: hypothetical protein HS128_01680 [Ideonella sp.]|nr:hypothetical protein [Ideonella sp.]MCC7459195.1 hypothetical protein [Nitrospira sp.]
MPYMSVAAIDAAINHVAATFPALARSIVLPSRIASPSAPAPGRRC